MMFSGLLFASPLSGYSDFLRTIVGKVRSKSFSLKIDLTLLISDMLV
jgi:hypothetical protein